MVYFLILKHCCEFKIRVADKLLPTRITKTPEDPIVSIVGHF